MDLHYLTLLANPRIHLWKRNSTFNIIRKIKAPFNPYVKGDRGKFYLNKIMSHVKNAQRSAAQDCTKIVW